MEEYGIIKFQTEYMAKKENELQPATQIAQLLAVANQSDTAKLKNGAGVFVGIEAGQISSAAVDPASFPDSIASDAWASTSAVATAGESPNH